MLFAALARLKKFVWMKKRRARRRKLVHDGRYFFSNRTWMAIRENRRRSADLRRLCKEIQANDELRKRKRHGATVH